MADRKFLRKNQGVPAVATRCDQTDASFAAAMHLVAGIVATA